MATCESAKIVELSRQSCNLLASWNLSTVYQDLLAPSDSWWARIFSNNEFFTSSSNIAEESATMLRGFQHFVTSPRPTCQFAQQPKTHFFARTFCEKMTLYVAERFMFAREARRPLIRFNKARIPFLLRQAYGHRIPNVPQMTHRKMFFMIIPDPDFSHNVTWHSRASTAKVYTKIFYCNHGAFLTIRYIHSGKHFVCERCGGRGMEIHNKTTMRRTTFSSFSDMFRDMRRACCFVERWKLGVCCSRRQR